MAVRTRGAVAAASATVVAPLSTARAGRTRKRPSCSPSAVSQRRGGVVAGGVSAAEPSEREEETRSFLICTRVSPMVRTSCTGIAWSNSWPIAGASPLVVSTVDPLRPYEASRNWRVPASVV